MISRESWAWAALAAGATLLCIVIGLAIGFLTAPFGRGLSEAGRAACDRYVETLLKSNDPTEIARAGIIVREVPCSISRRLKQ
jgi:hypothetical protein